MKKYALLAAFTLFLTDSLCANEQTRSLTTDDQSVNLKTANVVNYMVFTLLTTYDLNLTNEEKTFLHSFFLPLVKREVYDLDARKTYPVCTKHCNCNLSLPDCKPVSGDSPNIRPFDCNDCSCHTYCTNNHL